MRRVTRQCHVKRSMPERMAFCVVFAFILLHASGALALEPLVAIHVSENTLALESIPAAGATPRFSGTTGFEWWTSEWRYGVMPESMKEAMASEGIPFVEVSDADIAAGQLLEVDGTPRYPILISLAAEAIADSEIAPLRNYVAAGGFLFVGSSSFTRNPDGTTRGDFALAAEMGVHMLDPSLLNWGINDSLTRLADHRLVDHIPPGTLVWGMPEHAEEIPLGYSPSHIVHDDHFVFEVATDPGTTVLANGATGPLLATRSFGSGQFIYHSPMQPLVGHGVADAGMYAYLIYRKAIEWAFENAGSPIIKLSPWRFDHNAAFIVRHDFENFPNAIRSIESSAAFEAAVGAKGDYYFSTGTLREEMPDIDDVVLSIRRAVSDYGATIGSHNGGLRNPRNPGLVISDFDYWHWGPDEALDVSIPGYASGRDYALESIELSFQDIEGWLAGVDNGRPGCGVADDCPRIWASPYFNSVRDESYEMLGEVGAVVSSKGERKIGMLPHWTLSYSQPATRFFHVSMPASDWYVGPEIPGAIEWGHTIGSMQAAVDFYYDRGGMINFYGHIPSASGNIMGQYVLYSVAKPNMWLTNAVEVMDWWVLRSGIAVTPSFSVAGNNGSAQAAVVGSVDPGTAIEVEFPGMSTEELSTATVLIDGLAAAPSEYRIVGNTIKVLVGTAASFVEVQFATQATASEIWTQTDWSGGAGQALWFDEARYDSAVDLDDSIGGEVAPLSNVVELFFDDFTQAAGGPIAPWVSAMGTWAVNGNALQGSGPTNEYAYAYVPSTPEWTDYMVQADVQFPAGSFGGGIGGRVDEVTGAHYGAWVYPDGSAGGSNVLKLWKFRGWNDIGAGIPMQQVSLPSVGTGFHTLQMVFIGNRIMVYYDGQLRIDVTDNNFDGAAPYMSGGVSADWWTWSLPYTITVDNVFVDAIGTETTSGVLLSSAFDGGDGVQWQTVSWDVTGGSPADVCLQTRTADTAIDLATAVWSACHLNGDPVESQDRRWIQYQLALTPADASNPPRFEEVRFSFLPNTTGGALPSIGTLSPGSVVEGSPGFSLTINGSNFTADSVVQWNGLDRVTTYISPMQLTATITATDVAVAGTALVEVFDPTSGLLSNTQPFAIVSSDNPIPTTTGITPSEATAGDAGFTLTVNGTDFIPGSIVQWEGADRVTTFVSSTQLSAAITATDLATAGTALVSVFTPAPGGGASNSQMFTVNTNDNPLPTTTGINPSSVTAGAPGFTLTVSGTGFVAGSIVQWEGLDRTTTFVSSTQLTAAITASDVAAAGTALVTVFSPAPGGGASNAQTFTIETNDNPMPSTTGLTPSAATAGAGAFALTVNGTGFVPDSIVRWGGSDRATTFVSATQLSAAITATDVAAAGTALVTVFSPAPGGGASNAQTFTINESGGPATFEDDFTRDPGTPNPLSPWMASMGTWTVAGGELQGTNVANEYAYASLASAPQWTDYTVQGTVRMPRRPLGGGIGGRLDPTTGAHYGAWIYPNRSPGGPNMLKLWKFLSWTDIGAGIPMAEVNLPTVNTEPHDLRLTFTGNRIQVYFDGVLMIDVTDNNFEGVAPYASGGISIDWWTWQPAKTIVIDNVTVSP